ncbi:hypothetical protein KIMH_03000 [Bombiscardovia apis]|uniref:Uncharacterized protein n=1 Tax=Bombiscardovia apis TaxID=2932182 RepID=A0ABM8BBE3_9BIFI|nr:hypothetical protein [Bombiscardovia apis]BDR54189.1 hypothetical protein KIMH_03000 [Bombiscardovia apis]
MQKHQLSKRTRSIIRACLIGALTYSILWLAASLYLRKEEQHYQGNLLAWNTSVSLLNGINDQVEKMPKSMRGGVKPAENYPAFDSKAEKWLLGSPAYRSSPFIWQQVSDALHNRKCSINLETAENFNIQQALTLLDDLSKVQAKDS